MLSHLQSYTKNKVALNSIYTCFQIFFAEKKSAEMWEEQEEIFCKVAAVVTKLVGCPF